MSKGFTLIELLVTVAIVGILAGLALANFAQYREKAYDAVAISDLRNLQTAQELYLSQHGEYADNSGTGRNVLADPFEIEGFKVSEGVIVYTTGNLPFTPGPEDYEMGTAHLKGGSIFCAYSQGEITRDYRHSTPATPTLGLLEGACKL